MSTQQGALRDYVLNIEPGAQQLIQAVGDYFRVTSADGGKVNVSTSQGDAFDVQEGEGARVRAFDSLRVRNDSSITLRVRLIVGTGEFESSRTTGNIDVNPGSTLAPVAVLNGSGTIPANAERRQLVMRAANDNLGTVSVAGLPLYPGDTMTLDVTGAVEVSADNEPVYATPSIGDEINGGVYAGTITYADGREFHIIYALVDGDAYGLKWGNYGTTTGANDPDDGKANQDLILASFDDGSADAFYHARDYTDAEGNADYYLPSRNEAALIDGLMGTSHFTISDTESYLTSTENEATDPSSYAWRRQPGVNFEANNAQKSSTIYYVRPARRIAVDGNGILLADGDRLAVAEVV